MWVAPVISPGCSGDAPLYTHYKQPLIDVAEIWMSNWFWFPLLRRGAGTLGGWCTFLFQLKSRLSHNESEKCCCYADEPAGSEHRLRYPCVVWYMKEDTATQLHPPPPPPQEEARRYWIKSRRTVKSQFGAALPLLKSQTTGRGEFLFLHFMQQQGES